MSEAVRRPVGSGGPQHLRATRERQVEERRARVREAALALVDEGERPSIGTVARRAGISTSSVSREIEVLREARAAWASVHGADPRWSDEGKAGAAATDGGGDAERLQQQVDRLLADLASEKGRCQKMRRRTVELEEENRRLRAGLRPKHVAALHLGA